MSTLRREILFACLLMPSLACSVAGIWLLSWFGATGDRQFARWGEIFFFGGMTVVPILLWLLANCFIKSEQLRFRASQDSKQSVKIQKLEKGLRYSYFIKRHPTIIPLFCFGASIVSTGMALFPRTPSVPHQQVVFLHGMGIVLGLAYFVMLILFFYARLTNRWEPYMDESIRKLEEKLSRAKVKSKNDPSRSSS